MLNEQAKKGLARILQLSDSNDVEKIFESKFPGVVPISKSEGATKAILKHVQKPSEILCKKHIWRDVIVTYLKEIGVHVQKEQSKEACIRTCLHKWDVKKDNFWAKRPRSCEKVLGNLSRLDNYMIRKTEESTQKHCVKDNKVMITFERVQERNVLPRVKNQEKEVVQDLCPAQVLTKSPAEKLSNITEKSFLKRTPPVDSIAEQKRESTSFTSASRESYDIGSLFGDLSNLSSESSSCFPAVSKPERNQSILPSVPPHGPPAISKPERDQSISPTVPPHSSSAPTYHNNQKHSTSASKMSSPFSSEELHPRMMLGDQRSTEPPSFSPLSLDMNIPSMNTMENEFKSVTDTSVLSSESNHWIYEAERESPELSSTQPFSISIEADNRPLENTVEDEHKSLYVQPSVSSASSRCIHKDEHESSQVTRAFTSNLQVCSPLVTNASGQPFLAEPRDLSSNGFAVSQENQNSIWFSEKGTELSESHNNLCPTSTQINQQRFRGPPGKEGALSHHTIRNDYTPLQKRKDCTSGIHNGKRSRWDSPSDAGDYLSPFGNVNGSAPPPPFTRCPNCKRPYSSSSFYADRNKSDVSSNFQDYKKKRTPSRSKVVVSPEKQPRMSMEIKQAKKTSVASHVSRRSSTAVQKAKTGKKKYPTPSPSNETSPLHESPRQSKFLKQAYIRQRHKQSMLPFNKMNPKKKHSFVKSKKEDEDLSGSSNGCLLSENPTAEVIATPRPSSASPELLSPSESKLKSEDCSDISEGNGNLPRDSPASQDFEKVPLARPKRRCCTII